MRLQHYLILLSTFIVGRALIIILHETGHALFATAFSKKKATVYIGSLGNKENNITFRSGLITWHINNNPLYWKGGLCVLDDSEMKQVHKLIYILAGPILPALSATIFLYAAQIFHLHENIHVFAIFLLIGSVLSMIYNLVPKKNTIKLYDGSFTYNDGQAIKHIIKYWKMHNEYVIAINFYREKDYHKSADAFVNLINKGADNETTYRFAISSYLLAKQYSKAEPLVNESILKFKLSSDDYCNAGLTYSYLGDNEKAVELYSESLKLQPSNINSLNNKGYSLSILGEHAEAIMYFDKAIDIEPNSAYTYNNRGLSKIKTGAINDGFVDFKKSYSLDPDNSYYFKNMGIYHYDCGEFQKALDFFKKAQKLDSSTYMIDEHIKEVQEKLTIL